MKRSSTFAILLGISVGSHAYVLDGSCAPYRDMVIKGMKSAFDMSSAASFILGTIPPQSSGARWEAQRDLISYLYSEILTDGVMSPYTPNWEKVQKNFDDIQSLYKTNGDQPDAPPANNAYVNLNPGKVVIYCDYSRFNDWTDKDCDGNTKKGIVCDPNLKISEPVGDIWTGCKNSATFLGNSGLTGAVVQAWTSDYSAHNRPSVIQLCPGLLAKESKAYSQALTDQSKKPSLARAWGGLKKGLKEAGDFLDDPLRTPMDAKYSFDSTLLHEMSHALPGREVVESGGSGGSYGWKNCAKLSATGASTNADSYAYFALGARMISPNVAGVTAQRPMADGSIQVLPAPGKKRDDSPHPLKARNPSPELTLTIDNSRVVLNASNTAGFIVSVPSQRPVTVLPGKEYTIGHDTILLQGSALVEDGKTALLPVNSASKISAASTSSRQTHSNSITRASTFSTSTRSQNVSSLSRSSSRSISNSKGGPFSSSGTGFSRNSTSGPVGIPTRGPSSNSSTGVSRSSTLRSSSPKSSSPKSSSSKSSSSRSLSSKTSSLASHPLSSSSSSSHVQSNSSSQVLIGSKTSSSASKRSSSQSSQRSSTKSSSSSTRAATGSQSIKSAQTSQGVSGSWSNTQTSSASLFFLNIPTQTITSGPQQTSDSALLGALFIGLYTNRQWLTNHDRKSQFIDDVSKVKDQTEGLLKDLPVKVPDISDCHNTKRKRSTGAHISERRLRKLLERGIIGSVISGAEDAAKAVGSIAADIACASDVLKSITDAINPPPGTDINLGEVEDLTDTLAKLGEEMQDEKDDDKSSSDENKKTSSSCSTITTSACDTSFSIFTPAGATTATTSTVTLSCSTTTGCSASLTGSATTATGNILVSAAPIGDIFYEWGASTIDWFDVQQSFLSAADADTTDPYITWTADSTTDVPSGTGTVRSPPSASAGITGLPGGGGGGGGGSSGNSTGNSTISFSATSTSRSKSVVSSKHSVSRSSSISSSPKSTLTSPPITSCTLSSVAALSTAYPAYTIDYPATIACACNDGWSAGVANTVGSDGATTYYCEIGTTHIEVSTAAKPKPSPTSTAPTFTATPSTTLGDLTCYGDGVNAVVGPNYAFPDNLGQTSINYLCGSDGPKYESNPKYSEGWPDSPGYAGDWFFFDGTTEAFCGSTPYDMTDNGWWSTDAKCKGGDKSQVKIWVDVAFSADQTGCSPEKTWDIPKDQSCKDIYNTILGCKSPILKPDATYGGVLKQKTPNGCVDWRIWSTNGDNMGPS